MNYIHEGRDLMNRQVENNDLKIYTLSVPPTPEDPFLYATRHREIIECFDQQNDTFFTMNSQGEVDLYLLIEPEDSFDDFADVGEEFSLFFRGKDSFDLRMNYQEDIFYTVRFNLTNMMDKHILKWLLKEERINLYYINFFEEEYICTGLKITALPKGLIYDLTRFLRGKRSLLLPAFSEQQNSDHTLTRTRLLGKAWGFYLDYTALLRRIGSVEDTEEIVSRHIFDVMARLQQSKAKRVEGDELILWVGRKVCVDSHNQPKEYYSIYLSGDFVKNTKLNPAKLIVEKALSELPELKQIMWVAPLAEEGIPFALISAHVLARINLTHKFFRLCDQLFNENYLPHHGYINSYQQIQHKRLFFSPKTKVYSLVKKRRDKGITRENNLSTLEVMNLVQWGNKEDLTEIFRNIHFLNRELLDEAMYILSKKYKQFLEPFLFTTVENAASPEVKEAALVGLGLVESGQGISFLVEKLSGSSEEATYAADALLIIGDPVIPYLIPLLHHRLANIRLRVVKILGAIGSEEALTVLENMGNDVSVRVENLRKRLLNQQL
jgi:hypothetical protein